MSTDTPTPEAVEALAKVIEAHYASGFEEIPEGGESEYSGYSRAILDAGYLSPEQVAERVRAAVDEALRGAAEDLGDPRTLPQLADDVVFILMDWLRARAVRLARDAEGVPLSADARLDYMVEAAERAAEPCPDCEVGEPHMSARLAGDVPVEGDER